MQPSSVPARHTEVYAWTLRVAVLAVILLLSACSGSPQSSNADQSGPAAASEGPGGRASSPNTPPQPRPIAIQTREWQSGQVRSDATASGVLALDEFDCVFLGGQGYGERHYVVWPNGFTASVNQVGVLTLLNDGGEVVAVGGHDQTIGDQVLVRGELGKRDNSQERCMPSEGQVLFVQTASLDNP
jgi:hypothetical protein